jgi:hypothetical protein
MHMMGSRTWQRFTRTYADHQRPHRGQQRAHERRGWQRDAAKQITDAEDPPPGGANVMSRELRTAIVAFTVHKPEHLSLKNGEQMYADDVAEEVMDAVQQALTAWYAERGNLLLACEPDVG